MAYCGPRGIPLSRFLSWAPDDQQAALAWQAEEGLRCRSCGTAEWEWEQDRHAYRPESRVCRGCHLVGSEEKRNRKQEFPGLYVRLVRRGVEADG